MVVSVRVGDGVGSWWCPCQVVSVTIAWWSNETICVGFDVDSRFDGLGLCRCDCLKRILIVGLLVVGKRVHCSRCRLTRFVQTILTVGLSLVRRIGLYCFR